MKKSAQEKKADREHDRRLGLPEAGRCGCPYWPCPLCGRQSPDDPPLPRLRTAFDPPLPDSTQAPRIADHVHGEELKSLRRGFADARAGRVRVESVEPTDPKPMPKAKLDRR